MATSRAIAAVTMAIRRLLIQSFPGVDVELYQASDFLTPDTVTAPFLSIYLYEVTANTNRRNLPPRLDLDGRRFRPALPVDLSYLVSVWGSSVEEQHTLLGQALRVLEDTPTLPAAFLNDGEQSSYAGTFRADEAVELVYAPLSFTDTISLWDLLKPSIQPSGIYVARAVALESEIEIFLGDPVRQRQFDYARPLEQPIAGGRMP